MKAFIVEMKETWIGRLINKDTQWQALVMPPEF